MSSSQERLLLSAAAVKGIFKGSVVVPQGWDSSHNTPCAFRLPYKRANYNQLLVRCSPCIPVVYLGKESQQLIWLLNFKLPNLNYP
jgi:hypothetical protein